MGSPPPLLLQNEIGYRRGPSRAFFVTLFPNEVEYRRGIIRDYDPFPLPPSQTVQARFRAYSFPEETDNSFGNKRGLTHYAALQPEQFRCVPPAALCPVTGSPDLPGRS